MSSTSTIKENIQIEKGFAVTMNEKLKKLSQPVPEEYLEKYMEDEIEFTGYKAQYAINLLNEVLGLGTWYAVFELKNIQAIGRAWMAHGKVSVYLNTPNEQMFLADGVGGSYAKRIENALKGAKTSAFKNACRYLGIGNELYLAGHDEDIVYENVSEEQNNNTTENDVPNEFKETIDAINKADSIKQLETILPVISKTEGQAVKTLLIKKYNDKKITLSEK